MGRTIRKVCGTQDVACAILFDVSGRSRNPGRRHATMDCPSSLELEKKDEIRPKSVFAESITDHSSMVLLACRWPRPDEDGNEWLRDTMGILPARGPGISSVCSQGALASGVLRPVGRDDP